jgi:hypothetical protein
MRDMHIPRLWSCLLTANCPVVRRPPRSAPGGATTAPRSTDSRFIRATKQLICSGSQRRASDGALDEAAVEAELKVRRGGVTRRVGAASYVYRPDDRREERATARTGVGTRWRSTCSVAPPFAPFSLHLWPDAHDRRVSAQDRASAPLTSFAGLGGPLLDGGDRRG